ncbi:1-acyl-sn-glycerol-3-phosphate acyltransferase beta-like [Saccostrea cucullata]|uniref:1-acyl-sn-glycerol-3-phosphate acyltransferase beta-like n=1 Tax=Saccostrea cuccullata TaxID=36930 RepID=UPI002ED4F9C3
MESEGILGISYPVLLTTLVVGIVTWIFYDQVQFFAKHFLANLSWQVFSIFPIISSLFYGRIPTNRRYFSIGVKLANKYLIGTKYIVRGQKYVEDDFACIIISNHQSSLDGNFMVQLGNYKGSIVILKKSLLYASGLLGIAFYCTGAIFVNRSNPESAKKSLNSALDRIVKEKLKPQFYPEGTRHMGKEMLPFKKGAFVMAIQAQIPILPVVTSSYRHFYDKKRKIFKQGTVIVTCLPPIPTKGLTLNDLDDFVQKVRKTMQETIDKTTEEVENNL